VQQIDTTDGACTSGPANLFVATFLGSPAMNVLRGAGARADGLVAGLAKALRVPMGEWRCARAWLDRDIAIGVRPEHLCRRCGRRCFAAVEMVEPGNETS
jgi:multiple sugar transport system ATP-binding protein